MSKFSSYARKMNEIANATFAEYRAKSDAVKSAESKYNAYPRRNGADPSYMAKSARAEAYLAEARAQFEHCRRHLFEERRRDIAVIRAELVEALGNEYAADPSKVDMQTLELLTAVGDLHFILHDIEKPTPEELQEIIAWVESRVNNSEELET